jgi:DNA-binding LacI/PurR family transcriptional regulator
MRRRATGKEVAERAGVSLTTVSFVLNGRKDVAIPEETRQRVIDAARELGYRPNRLVRGLVRGRTQTVGVIVPRLDSSFHAAVVHGIQSVLAQQGYRTLLADSEHCFKTERHEVELLLEHRVDGIVSVALPDDVPQEALLEWVANLAGDGVPVVIVDDYSASGIADCVITDDEHGARMVVTYLAGLGHRRIAHLSAGSAMSSARSRRKGYEAAIRDGRLAVDPVLVAGTSYFMTSEETRAHVSRLLGADPRPTAIFCANDDMAAECVAAAREAGLGIPDDLSVAGYGDTAAGHLLDITTVHQDPVSMGKRAAERLLERLDAPDCPPANISLPVQLVVRGSTAAPAALTARSVL